MNHRVLFFLSLTVIAVGIAGIVMQRQTPQDPPPESARKSGVKVITIAEASRKLHPFDILQVDDYKLRTIEVDVDKQDNRDLSSLSSLNLNGYLVHNNITEEAAILPELIEPPTSETFVMHSLQGNELPYSYAVKHSEEYLLSSLKVGSKVSIFIRIAEVDKKSKVSVGFVPEGSGSSDKALKKYSLSQVVGEVTILNVKKNKDKVKNEYSVDQDEPVGSIVLKMSQNQLADLRVVEKSGDLIILSAVSGQGKNKRKDTDEVLPQFREIKELRGGK